MASYCCFGKPKQSNEYPRLQKEYPRLRIQNRGKLFWFQDIFSLLTRPEVGVIALEGIGGMGKTWAAKAVYQAARTSNIFDEYIWVTLSTSCSLRRCANKIASSLSSKISDTDNLSIERTKTLIKEYLIQRKFLLVLDNAYFTEHSILEYLGITDLQRQSPGSKIFVTTRTVRTWCVMETDIVLTPQPLTYDESYNLLRQKVGKHVDSTLVSYSCGIPLLIILLSGALSGAPTQVALSELVANAHVALKTAVSVFNAMQRMVKIAYDQLPSDTTRNCFLYCLLFPEDQGIPVKELIWYWVMDGVLHEAVGFDEANNMGKQILDILINRGMVYLEDNDHVYMHDVIRETLSRFGKDKGYKEQHDWHFDKPATKLEHLAKYSNRVPLMYTEMECLSGSPLCLSLSSLLLRGNYLLEVISEEFFCHMSALGILDLSFTRIKVLPPSIAYLTRLRMLLLIGCAHLEEIRHISSLIHLEVLDASGCVSLKSIDSGSFDNMVSLRILDLSATFITMLTSIPVHLKLRLLNLGGCSFLWSDLPYGVSKGGAVMNLQLGNIEDIADWMGMLWLPSGLTFQLSERFGMKVAFDVNGDSKTYVYATDAFFFKCLEKDSPLWFNCFQKFHIFISPLLNDQTTDTDFQVTRDFIVRSSCYRKMYFADSIDMERCLEINCTIGVPSGLEAILYYAELISLKRLNMMGQFSDLNIRNMKSVRELRIENYKQLGALLTPEEVYSLSAVGNLRKLWISNIENLSSFCKGMNHVTSFSCLKDLIIDCCPHLTCLFPSELRIPNLEMLHIRFCDILETVFHSSVLGEDSLPRLQSLRLWNLPVLTCVCGGVLPALKKLEVRDCAKLQKVPVGVNKSNFFVTTVIGEKLWWDSLIWDDQSIKRFVVFRKWGPLLPHLATDG